MVTGRTGRLPSTSQGRQQILGGAAAQVFGAADGGAATDLNWTIDVDDNAGADLLLLSGNRKLPPNDWMSAVVQAVRLGEDRFMRCVREFR